MEKLQRQFFWASLQNIWHGNHNVENQQNASSSEYIFEKHQHKPLPTERAIRLISIERHDLISLKLKHFSLLRLPAYKALSYTWDKAICENSKGDRSNESTATQKILVNNRSFYISENLFDALVQLKTESVGWIWIDAICIDQTNPRERSSQVLLMGEIYSQANTVIIWLGKDIEDVDTMLWVQDVLYEKYGEGSGKLTTFGEPLLLALNIDAKKWIDVWSSVENFFRRRRWYRRAWVFQETVLARQIELRNGKSHLDWKKLSLMTQVAVDSGYPIVSGAQCIIISAHMADSKNLSLLQDPQIIKGQAERWIIKTGPQCWYSYLLRLVDNLRCFQASCEHDKIYAALGPAQKLATSDITELIVPDYESSWEVAFVEFTTLILKQLPCLLILSSVGSQGRPHSLPSWCPDYRFTSSTPFISPSSEEPHLKLFSASGFAGATEAINFIRENILSVNGQRIDIITQSTENLYQMIDIQQANSIEPCLEICSMLPPIYDLTLQDRLEVLWRTMIIDQYYDATKGQQQPAPPRISENFLAWIKNAWTFELYDTTVPGQKTIRRPELIGHIRYWNEIFKSSSLRLPPANEISNFADHLAPTLNSTAFDATDKGDKFLFDYGAARWASGRCLFRTSQHQMFGLGPQDVQEGDEVWLLKEAMVPFVLRPQSDGCYNLVGEAYVHGIMHGEWLEGPGRQDLFKPLEIV